MDKERNKKRIKITFFISSIVFSIFLLLLFIIYLLFRIFIKIDLLTVFNKSPLKSNSTITIIIIASIIVGYALSFIFSDFIMKPINKVVNSMQQLSKGNFKERLHFGKLDRRLYIFYEVSDSFNKMAKELEHTQTISSDFMNNFSHEFKTPIVSISGFAKLLKKGGLSQEQQLEYLDIIDEESTRLADMAVSVLKLSKVKNQTILSDITNFNLSEQIRNCFLLLQNKWENKDIDFQLDFEEFNISASEELLKQVWINLLDNAIKFTPPKETIKIDIKEKDKNLIISVINTGSQISPESQCHIFTEFYQADESHSSQGNGIGLAIVKKIVELHKGNICVISGNMKTIFVVTLPENLSVTSANQN